MNTDKLRLTLLREVPCFVTHPMRDNSPKVALIEGIRSPISGVTSDQSPEWRQALHSKERLRDTVNEDVQWGEWHEAKCERRCCEGL